MTGAAGQDSPLEAFADQMRLLRRECAWKREQTHTSLVPFVREEAEEVVEAIESGDPAALCDELGDLLLEEERFAEIAGRHVADPHEELRDKRPVEAEPRADGVDVLRGGRGTGDDRQGRRDDPAGHDRHER